MATCKGLEPAWVKRTAVLKHFYPSVPDLDEFKTFDQQQQQRNDTSDMTGNKMVNISDPVDIFVKIFNRVPGGYLGSDQACPVSRTSKDDKAMMMAAVPNRVFPAEPLSMRLFA